MPDIAESTSKPERPFIIGRGAARGECRGGGWEAASDGEGRGGGHETRGEGSSETLLGQRERGSARRREAASSWLNSSSAAAGAAETEPGTDELVDGVVPTGGSCPW